MFARSVSGSKSGMTLVEVLVTMVVLVIGILTVIRMFPTGFGIVSAAESETIATKLAQGEIERWKNFAANLPTGILPIDKDGNVLNGQYPGPPFATFVEEAGGEFTVTGPDGEPHTYTRGNALNIRQIIGETTRIPVGSYFQTAVGSSYGGRYTLAFGPIDVYRDDDGKLVGLAVKSGDLRRIRGRRELFPPYLRLGEYAIDPGDRGTPQFYVAFPAEPTAGARVYYFSYSYWAVDNISGSPTEGDPVLLSKLDQEVAVPPGYNGDWIPVPVTVPTGYDFDEFESGTETCARAFVEVSGPWPTDDPYQFALSDNILGVISFNPVGHGMYEYTAQGLRPIEARIDYRIYDPRIIRENRVVPQPEPGAVTIPVKLALRFILDIGDPTDNPTEPTYEGMAPRIGLTESVLLIDLSTGMRVDMTNVRVDYMAGIVNLPKTAHLLQWDAEAEQTVPVGDPVPLAGRQLRFFYRADGDWTIQCQKAYAYYSREGAELVDYRHYKMGDHPHRRLYFAKCEAEKTVAVDYSYRDADRVEHKVVGESHRISDYADTNGLHFIDLNLPPDTSVRRVYAVVGTSFRVRVIWRDKQGWRYVDMDTNLVRGTP